MKKILLFSLFLFLAWPCFAQTQQVLIGGMPSIAMTTASDTYQGLYANADQDGYFASFAASEPNLFPNSGTLRYFRVVLSGAPSSGTYTFTINDNNTDTVITTGAFSGSSASDLTHTIHVKAGDLLEIHVHPAGSPTAEEASWVVDFIPDVNNEVALGTGQGNFGTITNGNLIPISVGHGYVAGTGDGPQRVTVVMPCAGTLTNLYAVSGSALGSGNSLTFTVVQNGSTTSLSTEIQGTSQTSNEDTANPITISAGDQIYVSVAVGGTVSGIQTGIGATFIPSVPGQFPIMMGNASTQWTNNANTYNEVSGRPGNEAAAGESLTEQVSNAMTIQAIYVFTDTAPGSNTKFTFSLRDNGATPSGGPSCYVGGSSNVTICNSVTGSTGTSGTATVKNGDLLDTQIVPTSTPGTQTTGSVSYLAYSSPVGYEKFLK